MAGIYSEIAVRENSPLATHPRKGLLFAMPRACVRQVPLKGGVYRSVSLALLAKVLSGPKNSSKMVLNRSFRNLTVALRDNVSGGSSNSSLSRLIGPKRAIPSKVKHPDSNPLLVFGVVSNPLPDGIASQLSGRGGAVIALPDLEQGVIDDLLDVPQSLRCSEFVSGRTTGRRRRGT
jgi:hypothetical protein